jgi:hypothetical protein
VSPKVEVCFLSSLFGALVGAAPGLILASSSGELLGLTFLGLGLIVAGLIAGASIGWRKSDWLNAGGVIGGLVGLVPGIVMLLFEPEVRIVLHDPLVDLRWNEIVTIVFAVGLPLGLFLGNRVARSANQMPKGGS